MSMANKAVFFDRDGTLNVDVHYLHRPEDFIWIKDAKKAIKYVKDRGYLAILVTNQSGVARGFYPESDVVAVYDWMNQELSKIGTKIDDLYYCPHHPNGKIAAYSKVCDCRKPSPLLVNNACQKYNIAKNKSYFVGDTVTDMQCAKNAGIIGIKYENGSLYDLIKSSIK